MAVGEFVQRAQAAAARAVEPREGAERAGGEAAGTRGVPQRRGKHHGSQQHGTEPCLTDRTGAERPHGAGGCPYAEEPPDATPTMIMISQKRRPIPTLTKTSIRAFRDASAAPWK